MVTDDFRTRLRSRTPLVGLWSCLPGVSTAALLARNPVDYVVFDLQHGAVGENELPGLSAVVEANGVTPLVRARSASFADVGRALDLGAHGVFVPNVRGADHVREVVGFCRYGPDGSRSIGRLVGGSVDPACLLVLETREALDELDDIVRVDGVDGIYVGPMDLALSLGRAGADHADYMRKVVADVVQRCVQARMPVGVHAYAGAEAAGFRAAGATVITAAVDTAVLSGAIAAEVGAAGGQA